MKRFLYSTILFLFLAITFSACSSHKEEAPDRHSDDVLWQQYRSDKALKGLDEE